jgi:hypothetical protein
MFIHQHTCISAQQTFADISIDTLRASVNNKLKAVEPVYQGIPGGILRRMGKAVKMGVGAGLPIIKNNPDINGIIIGTANGGMEDCIKFLNQIIDYEEGMLTPGNFVQSTPNAIAAQLGLMSANKLYNITHVHRGLAFESALIDAMMMLKENPDARFLVGGVDEISAYNYNIDYLDGWYKKNAATNVDLYSANTEGSIAGEGAAMFLVNNDSHKATAAIKAIKTIHTADVEMVKQNLEDFIKQHTPGETTDMLLTGENGDNRLTKYYTVAESLFNHETLIARYKHMSGEFPTSSAIALWLACALPSLPEHCIKRKATAFSQPRTILIYNNYKGTQHSFILVQKVV